MSRQWDLAVIGGGPGGAATAALAASKGARVVLVERDQFPRDKVCGEFVSAEGCRTLERLGALAPLTGRGARPIDSCRVTELAGGRVDAGLPRLRPSGAPGLGVTRALLDGTLLDCARRAGAEVLQRHEASEPLFERGRVVGLRVRPVGRAGSARELRARLIVAADGRRSFLARRLHPRLGDPRASDGRSWFGLKTHLTGEAGRLGRRVELHLFEGGYAGLGPVEDDRINVCLLVRVDALRACGGRPERVFGERLLANPALRETVGRGERAGRWHSVGPLRWGVRRPAAAGVLFVGDAAGTIDPLCGEGISNALLAAELAQSFIGRAIERGHLSDEAARAYARAWRRMFAPVTRRVRALGRLLERPRLAAPLLRLLAGPGRGLLPGLVARTRTGMRN